MPWNAHWQQHYILYHTTVITNSTHFSNISSLQTARPWFTIKAFFHPGSKFVLNITTEGGSACELKDSLYTMDAVNFASNNSCEKWLWKCHMDFKCLFTCTCRRSDCSVGSVYHKMSYINWKLWTANSRVENMTV